MNKIRHLYEEGILDENSTVGISDSLEKKEIVNYHIEEEYLKVVQDLNKTAKKKSRERK